MIRYGPDRINRGAMANLNHINLAVPDVLATRIFFETYLGMTCVETKGQDVLTVLRDADGFVLILSNFDKKTVPEYPRDFHVGFIQKSNEQVNAIYERMRAGGADVKLPRTAHGSWGFYVAAPGGIVVEVSSYENETGD